MSGILGAFFGKPKPSLIPETIVPVVQALDRELERDTKFIGEVFRKLSKGMTAEEIAREAGHKSSKNVMSFEYAIRGLRGDTPAKNIKYKSRDQMIFAAERLITTTSNAELKEYLQGKLNKVNAGQASAPRSTSSSTPVVQPTVPAPSTAAAQPNAPATDTAAVESRPGVYVYSYPQYLSMESVSPNGTAFYKIGASDRVASRIERQARQTEVPRILC